MTELTKPVAPEPVSELGRVVQAATEALSDGMVERLATTAGNALEVVDRLNDEDTRDAILHLIEGLTKLHRAGALDTLFEVVYMLHAARAAATDSMVDRLFAFVEHMVNNLATEEVATLAHEAKGALDDALEDCAKDTGGGLLSTLRMLNQPETQQALRFMLSFSCKLRSRTAALAK